MSYVELHCHSCYSLRDGASSPEQLVRQAAALGYRALALTDHDGLYGAMEFAKAAVTHGIRPITGAEVTLTGGYHLTLLAETRAGYQNLCDLISAAYLDHGKDTPEVTLESLRDHAQGLIALSGCRKGEVARWLVAGDLAEAEAAAARYRDWFGPECFFIEVQQNLVQGDTARIAALTGLARRVGLGIVATNDVHYHVRERHRLHDVLVAIRHRATLDTSHVLRHANSELFLKGPEEMAALFRDLPEAVANAGHIADRCQFNLATDLGYEFPRYSKTMGATEDEYLGRICWNGFKRKYGKLPKRVRDAKTPDDFTAAMSKELRAAAKQRLTEELRLIRKHKLAGFFLTYRDILSLANQAAHELNGRDLSLPPEERPVGRGRGSSVASIVCYLIGLSHIDPVKNNLFLGRFLNEELASVPDIDLDFPREIRAELLAKVYDFFGRESAALVCSFPTYRGKSAIRDIGKVLGLPAPMLDKLAKLSDHWGGGTLADEMRRHPEFRDRIGDPIWRDLIDLAEQLRGFPRHIGQHVGGIVLANGPIRRYVPVEPARMDDRYVIQWDKDSVDDARMVKIDFLALGMLSAVEECLDTIEQRHGDRPDLGRIPHDTPTLYDQICAGDTMGLFQIESRAQIQTLPRTQPRTIDDLAVQVAIVRPGPIVSGAFRPYMEYRRRQRNGEPVNIAYAHPCLAEVLADTLGVVLYQDQVLQVAMVAADYTAGEADQLRRAMSRRRSYEALSDHWPRFLAGAQRRHGMSEEAARAIFDSMLGFAAFGFPHSHAVAFALLAYESAYLRHNYPAEFYASLINNQPMGFYSVEVLLGDAERHGIRTLRPDINLSGVGVTVPADDSIRLGLDDVQSVGGNLAKAIVADRVNRGDYRSLFDFVSRIRPRRETSEHLILAGAFDDLGLDRRDLVWQLGLFNVPAGDQTALDLSHPADLPALRPFNEWDTVIADFRTLGLSPYCHPLALLRRDLPRRILSADQLPEARDGATIELAGMIVCRQRPATAKGVLFLLLEDETGLANVIVSPPQYDKQRLLIRGEPFVTVTGRLQKRDGTINILADRFAPLHRPLAMPAPASHNFR